MGMDGISDVMLWMKYSNTVEVIDEFVISNPGATVAELRVYAEAQDKPGGQRLRRQRLAQGEESASIATPRSCRATTRCGTTVARPRGDREGAGPIALSPRYLG